MICDQKNTSIVAVHPAHIPNAGIRPNKKNLRKPTDDVLNTKKRKYTQPSLRCKYCILYSNLFFFDCFLLLFNQFFFFP